MTVGGAGAGYDQFLGMIKHLIPYIEKDRAALFINFGDHKDVYEKLKQDIRMDKVKEYFNEYSSLKKLAGELKDSDAHGIYAIYNSNIFEAVYSTNLLMPECDILITKPSELAYYPIPKLFMRHIGGHEVYGAVNSQEAGDGTFECPTVKEANDMIDRLITDSELYCHICGSIDRIKAAGGYDGAYNCVKLAAGIQ